MLEIIAYHQIGNVRLDPPRYVLVVEGSKLVGGDGVEYLNGEFPVPTPAFARFSFGGDDVQGTHNRRELLTLETAPPHIVAAAIKYLHKGGSYAGQP